MKRSMSLTIVVILLTLSVVFPGSSVEMDDLVFPEFKSEVRHFSIQAAMHISLNMTAGCLKPKHFFGL